MHDLPAQTLLQQSHARPVSGEELEVMGKKAASRYLCGECNTLNNAVVETVKQAGLSPEQVKRVIEFANTNAYIEQFNKLGSEHKYVEFHGGPADPSAILKDLNDGGGGSVFDRGLADYSRLPMEKSSSDLLAQNRARMGLEKTATLQHGLAVPATIGAAFGALHGADHDKPLSGAVKGGVGAAVGAAGGELIGRGIAKLFKANEQLPAMVGHVTGSLVGFKMLTKGMGVEKHASVDFNPAETAFEQMWQSNDAPLPYAEPFQDIIEMREKLADSKAQLTSDLNSLEVDYIDVSERLYGLVKQAALEETPLGHVIQAWGEVVPGHDFVKAAFSLIGPRLVEENVFNYDEMGASMSKTAAAYAVVDMEHPLVESFSRFCDVLVKLAATRDVLAELHDAHEKAEYFLTRGMNKVARNLTEQALSGEGLIPKVWRGAKDISARVADPASRLVEAGVGKLVNRGAGEAAGEATKWTMEHAPHIALGIGALEAHDRLKYAPAYQKAKQVVLERVPYTPENAMHQYELQSQMMGYGQ